MEVWLQWLKSQVRTYVGNERGQDAIVVLLLIFIIWLLVTQHRIVVQ